MRLNRLCHAAISDDLWVSVHGPLLIHNETQFRPDLTIHRSAPRFELAMPARENTLLLMEIADLSLDFDLNKKLPYYGKWQIPEEWLFDLKRRRIERHTAPKLEGYTRVEAVQGHGELTSTTLPGLTISVKATMG
jgi:Uma2 family endonuclease